MNISDMFADSTRVVRQNTRARIFTEHRMASVHHTIGFALVAVLLWGADWGLDADSAKKTLLFRLAITGVLLVSALAKWLSKAIAINCLLTYVSLVIGEVLTLVLLTKLTGGITAGSGQLLYFFLGAVLLTPHLTTKWVVPGSFALAATPHLAGIILTDDFPHLLYASVIWPAFLLTVLMHAKIRPIMVENVRLRQDVESSVLFDPVTGLLNKRGLEHSFQRLVKMGEAKPLQQFLLLIEIDGLDKIRKANGEETARSILAQMGQTIEFAFRGRDITASLGDEFACILVHLSRENAFDIAERFRNIVAGKVFECENAPNGKLSCTVSIGIISADTKETINSLTNLARVGVNQAKSMGGNHSACI